MMVKKVLLVNDDGIYHSAFKATVEAFKRLGCEITICAPLNAQSAKSHAIEIRNTFEVKKVDIFEGIEAYAIDSTPADCVRFAKYYLNWEGDLVVSGVNDGLNLGDDILYSGTVAAAIEAGIRGYNALALSASVAHPENCTDMLEDILKFIEDNKLYDKWCIWSFNIHQDSKGFKFAKQGCVYFDTYFAKDEAGKFAQLGHPQHELDIDKDSDVYLYHQGYSPYSAMTYDKSIAKFEK